MAFLELALPVPSYVCLYLQSSKVWLFANKKYIFVGLFRHFMPIPISWVDDREHTIEIFRKGDLLLGQVISQKEQTEGFQIKIEEMEIDKEEGKISIDFTEITPEELHKMKAEQDYVQELAEKLKDSIDPKKLLEETLGDMTKEEREDLMERLEKGGEDAVEDKKGCYELKVSGKRGRPQHITVRR